MTEACVFKPKDGNELLVRSPMNEGVPVPRPASMSGRPATQGGYRFGQLSHNSFFTRHNPHPHKVRHIKGLLDLPICAVNDDGYFANPQYSPMFPPDSHNQGILQSRYVIPQNAINVNSQLHPINTLTGLQNFTGLQSYPFREKAIPRFGLVPVTDQWREELRLLTEAAGLSENRPGPPKAEPIRPRTSQYSEDTGRLLPPPSRGISRQASRQGKRSHFFNHLEHIAGAPDMETLVLQMLCQILQTEDVNAVQAWLMSAGEREKSFVMDMIRTAVSNQQEYYQNSSQYYGPLGGAEEQRPATGVIPQYHDHGTQTNGFKVSATSGKVPGCGDSKDIIDSVEKMGLDNVPTGLRKSADKWTRYSWTPEQKASEEHGQKQAALSPREIKEKDDLLMPPKSPAFRVKHSPHFPVEKSRTKSQENKPLIPADNPPRLKYTSTPKREENADKIASLMSRDQSAKWQPERSVSQTLKVHD